MAEVYLLQLVGAALIVAGAIVLAASAHAFGIPLSPAERRRASDEWNRKENVRRWPIKLEALASMVFITAGIGILIWSKFSLCEFLGYWLQPLPPTVGLLLSCR